MSDTHTWSARVTASMPEHSTTYLRSHQLAIGAPLSFDSEYELPTALECFLAAVGSDVVGGLFAKARRRSIRIDNVEATIDCSLNNPLTFLDVVGEQGTPGIESLRVALYLSTIASNEDVDELWHATLRTSPLINTLREATSLDLSYKIVL